MRAELTYMPLGSLTFVPASSPPILTAEPVEFHDGLQFLVPGNHSLFECLSDLFSVNWIRLFLVRNRHPSLVTLRVYLLPDDVGQASIPRDHRKVRIALRNLMTSIDNGPSAWAGQSSVDSPQAHYSPTCGETDSLFYIFNTLESPKPDVSVVKDTQAANAIADILEDSLKDAGMRTRLYPYQQRSAAAMIQREFQPGLQLDPRLEVMYGPTGIKFYFERVSCDVLSEPRSYDKPQGGILAESMGQGKTLICLAAILSTKNHLPHVPQEYLSELRFSSNGLGACSLKQLAMLAIYRHNIPWKPFFKDLAERGQHYDSCVKTLEKNVAFYSILERGFGRRQTTHVNEKRIYLSSATLIIVPSNLIAQWRQEIETHLEEESLSILMISSSKQALPPVQELLKYDVILMSRSRFEDEISPRPGTSDPCHVCQCHFSIRACQIHGRSPLLDIHFLRFIVDEGHNFSSSGHTNRATFSLKAIRVERKWIVSGTPSNSMLGLELDLTAEETLANQSCLGDQERKQAILANKKDDIAIDQERKDIASLGRVVMDFLGLKPWANAQFNDDTASWQRYIMPNQIGLRKPASLRNVLEDLVIRHRNVDIEQDLQLPPLSNRIVRLGPCFFDKLSVNLFLQVIAANAVTSERTDQDYMFHPKNRPALDALFRNLRQSGFFWTGFSRSDVVGAIKNSQSYLDDQTHKQALEDCRLLEKAVSIGQIALNTTAWEKFHESMEIGVYVDDFPSNYKSAYGLCKQNNQSPLLLGVTQLVHAQGIVDKHAYGSDPIRELAATPGTHVDSSGISVGSLRNEGHGSPTKSKHMGRASIPARVVPESSLGGPLKLTSHQFGLHGTKNRTLATPSRTTLTPSRANKSTPDLRPALKTPAERRPELPSKYTELKKANIVGTASAKFTYLLDRIIELHLEEKILIFYEDDHIAYYLAQGLETLGIEHLIYANSLKLDTKTHYLHLFNAEDTFRVMLMDLKQAAHGLHVASASRVFFVNPVWSPSIEAQAIKRAHRIGQSRPVYAETLILRDTPEDQMLQRRKAMTSREHQKASRSPLDDMTMNDIIKNAKFIEFSDDELADERCQMARLKKPQQVFVRSLMGYASSYALEADSGALAKEVSKTVFVQAPSPAKRKIMFVDVDRPSQAGDQGSPEAYVLGLHKKRRKAMFADEVSLPLVQKCGGVEARS